MDRMPAVMPICYKPRDLLDRLVSDYGEETVGKAMCAKLGVARTRFPRGQNRSQRSIGAERREEIYAVLNEQGPMTRSQIRAVTKLTVGVVEHAVSGLIKEGRVRKANPNAAQNIVLAAVEENTTKEQNNGQG